MKRQLFILMVIFITSILGGRVIQYFIFDVDPMVEKLTLCLKYYSNTKNIKDEVKLIRLTRRVQVMATQKKRAYTAYTFIVKFKKTPDEVITLRVFERPDEEYNCEQLQYDVLKN